MSGVVEAAPAIEVDDRKFGDDSAWINGAEAYPWCPTGISVLGHITAMQKTLALSATSRNWNTVQKLAALTRAETGS